MKWFDDLAHNMLVSWRWRQLCKIYEKRERVLAELMQCIYGSVAAERLEPVHDRLQAKQDLIAMRLGMSAVALKMSRAATGRELRRETNGRFPPPPRRLYHS